jgi:predicted nucleic acid-binding protein
MAFIIVDSGPLVALLDRGEKHHAWAQEQLRGMEGPLLTCDAVLTEVCYLLADHPTALKQLHQFLQKKLILTSFQTDSLVDRIFSLMAAYANVPMSFADACLVCLVEAHPGSVLFTLDRDFTIYRQQRRRLIPLVAPFMT